MQISQSEIEIETLVGRISKGDIDLQPDFQRGDVWSRSKKRKLIDSILRGWKIPPVHIIEDAETNIWSVLDGQQRLTSIRDFISNKFPIDGMVAPLDPEIARLDKKYFSELEDNWRRRIMGYEVRFIKLKYFRPEESAELFYRLNQPTILTAAEQRNAFFGIARDQIKSLVSLLVNELNGGARLGFSNSRLAYDDVIARLCVFLENQSVWDQVSPSQLADKYRNDAGFEEDVINNAAAAIKLFSSSIKKQLGAIRFTKASLLSWLYFFATIERLGSIWTTEELGEIVFKFERERLAARIEKTLDYEDIESYIFKIYNERLSYKVTDPASVAERDAIIWLYSYINSNHIKFKQQYPARAGNLEAAVEAYRSQDWGKFVSVFSITDWGKKN